jgi:agmatine deiminase
MSAPLRTTPRADGYRMPAEWEPHRGSWLIWPERTDNWRNGGKPAQVAFARVAEVIAEHEAVTVCVSAGQYVNARQQLPDTVRVVEMSTNDAWIRDCGPTFVVNEEQQVRGVDWVFNAWGGLEQGLYFPWDDDDLVAQKVLDVERDERYAPEFVLEGGSIDVDGQGTVLTTEECLLRGNRNPSMDRAAVEWHLREYLGVESVLWLPRGVYLDETNGHVDNIARFVAPGHVVLTWTDDVADPQYAISVEALALLRTMRDARGRELEVTLLHQPGPIVIGEDEASGVDHVPGTQPRRPGDRLAGSYVNSYIANGVVVLPVFDDPHDELAVKTYEQLFPGRRVVPVPGREILLGGGNVHCITQQEPVGHRSLT